MRRIVLAPIILMNLSVVAQGHDRAKSTPAEQYQALRREYDRVPGGGVAQTDAEHLRFVGQVYKHYHAVARKLFDLAATYPDDPIALDALMKAAWQVNTVPWPVELIGEDTVRAAAFKLIVRDHLESAKLSPLCQRVAAGFAQEYETFLRAVLAKSPHQSVRATAQLALGHFLNNRLQRVDLCRERPEAAREFAGLYGADYLTRLRRQDRTEAVNEIEAVFEQAIQQYGDFKLPSGATVAERATAELFGIRHLSVGKEAPEIEGEDQHGRRFKLSDYRGKVVLLDFWSYV